jgi:hypothetical protein
MATDCRIAAFEVTAVAQQPFPVRSPAAARDYWALTNNATETPPGVSYLSNMGLAAKRVAPGLSGDAYSPDTERRRSAIGKANAGFPSPKRHSSRAIRDELK